MPYCKTTGIFPHRQGQGEGKYLVLKVLPIRLTFFSWVYMLCTLGTAYAQEKEVVHANQQWIQYYPQLRISEHWSLLADVGFRWQDGFDSRTQYIIRAGASRNMGSGISLGAGIAHLGSYGNENLERVEFRPYQDLGLKHAYPFFELTHRLRVEERFFNPVSNGRIESPNTFNMRFRYALTATIPIVRLSEKSSDRLLLLLLGDELFINAGRGVVTNIFDQNRILIIPTLQWHQHFSIGLAWSNQYASTQIPSSYRHTNVYWLQLRHQIDLRKKTQSL
jgi:hypothetical protein